MVAKAGAINQPHLEGGGSLERDDLVSLRRSGAVDLFRDQGADRREILDDPPFGACDVRSVYPDERRIIAPEIGLAG
jgi:hypothetical protein